MSDIVAAAEAKRARIIEREGDADGIRRRPEYLYQLIAEEAAFRDMVQGIKKEGSRQLTGQTLSYRDHNQP